VVQWIAVAGILFGSVTAVLYAAKAGRIRWNEEMTTALTADLQRMGGAALSGKVQCLSTLAECDTTLDRMGLVQSTGMMYDFFLFGDARSLPVRDARRFFWKGMAANPPEVIVVGLGAFPAENADYSKLAKWPQFAAYLSQNYVVEDEQKFKPGEGGPLGFRLYVRRKTPAASAAQ
jgi:hypothetical protein